MDATGISWEHDPRVRESYKAAPQEPNAFVEYAGIERGALGPWFDLREIKRRPRFGGSTRGSRAPQLDTAGAHCREASSHKGDQPSVSFQ